MVFYAIKKLSDYPKNIGLLDNYGCPTVLVLDGTILDSTEGIIQVLRDRTWLLTEVVALACIQIVDVADRTDYGSCTACTSLLESIQLILQTMLKGELVMPEVSAQQNASVSDFTEGQRKAVFWLGVGGLIFVPIFKSITHLPPFVGILLVLGVLWTATEVFYRGLHRGADAEGTQKRVTKLLSRVDMSTILFFLGILMAVSCLAEIGVLTALGQGLNVVFDGNHYLVTGIIGVLSSIVDNVPLVAGCMGMYPVAAAGDMAVDGVFWQLLAYCAGVGGSMLIIGSAAGVVVMGLEKITFGWYMKHISWIAFVGYIAGIVCYWFIRTFLYAI